MLGNFFIIFFCCLLTFFKINFFKKIFQEHYQSAKQFGSRSGPKNIYQMIARVIVENIFPRNMIINLGCASVDNHIPRDDIFDYHPRRECNIYILFSYYPYFFTPTIFFKIFIPTFLWFLKFCIG